MYEAGGLYFVIDGHHRVALAHQLGNEYIDAEVTEIKTSHRLRPDVDVLELVHTEQHRRFEEQTELAEAAPGAVIEFSRPVGYGELLQVIEAHAYEMSRERGVLVSASEATRDWYASSWMPGLEAIEASGLRKAYDFKTDGDRYLWTYRKLQEFRTSDRSATWTDAASALREAAGQSSAPAGDPCDSAEAAPGAEAGRSGRCVRVAAAPP